MKRIIYIHGRDYKPKEEILIQNWNKSIAHGLQRDYSQKEVDIFQKTKIDMAYYGDISNIYLDLHCDVYDENNDIEDRTKCIEKLLSYKKSDFTKNVYKKLPFKNSILQTIAHFASKLLYILGFGDKLIGLFAPDIKHYWNPDSDFGSQVREPLTQILAKAFEDEDEVLLLSHSLGTMIAYDVLWKFSHYSEYKHLKNKTLDTWLTLGSPLGDENVKNKLKGAQSTTYRKYPENIKKWFNIASYDDFIAHDENIQDDFKAMQVDLVDIRNYNLSVRYGVSDPHHAVGYLISPEIIKIIAQWLK